MFEATIDAKTLKRVIYPLFMLNDAGIFKIDSTALTCQAANLENTEIAQAIMPADADAWDNFTHGGLATRAHTVGIDLKWMMAMLNDLSTDGDRIRLNIGMHRLSRRLIDASKIRKPPKGYDQSHTARMDMQGGFFVAMIKYLAAGEAIGLEIRAYKDDVQFDSTYDEDNDPRHYSLGVDGLTEYSDDTRGIYGIEYLIDIAAGIQPNDTVSLRFGKDTPIEIGYEVDGCEIRHILAPRIGDEVI
jgi:hypothetical protein